MGWDKPAGGGADDEDDGFRLPPPASQPAPPPSPAPPPDPSPPPAAPAGAAPQPDQPSDRPPARFGAPPPEFGGPPQFGPPPEAGPPPGSGAPPPPAVPPSAPALFASPPPAPPHPSAYASPWPPQPAAPPEPPQPPEPADRGRAAAVALLNLSGLGLGYALIRRWLPMAVCLAATAALLLVALPADPDGVPGGVLAGYLAVLALAALHGGYRALRTRLSWPPRTPLALLLGLVLLAVPVGGGVLYDGERDEAVEQMLLDRLEDADQLVEGAGDEPFASAESDYRKALRAYRDLAADHPGSRAADRVPNRLKAYYETVAAPYGREEYCDAIEPLTYLRTVPDTVDRGTLGSLAAWPDDRLATSLYECGLPDLGSSGADASDGGHLGELLTSFPESEQAAKVEPAVSDLIDAAAKELKGDDPCAATERLRTLGDQAEALPGEKAGVADALAEDSRRAGKHVRSGTYACGVDQFEDGDFDAAQQTMDDFVSDYPDDGKRERAEKTAIAAEIAQVVPAAGRKLPSTGSGGGSIPVTVLNDSPDEIEILYTGPVTGRFTLKACGSCSYYPSAAKAKADACGGSESKYPRRTLTLPRGTVYFLHKSVGGSARTDATDTIDLDPSYIYTECAYTTTDFALDL